MILLIRNDFINVVEDNEKVNILDYLYFYNGGGVAAGDINNDGLIDLFFVSNLEENKLYLNKGGLNFMMLVKKQKLKESQLGILELAWLTLIMTVG